MASKELETFAQYERYYDAAGIRTRCFEKGEGKPVILLHGGGGHAETWVRNSFHFGKVSRACHRLSRSWIHRQTEDRLQSRCLLKTLTGFHGCGADQERRTWLESLRAAKLAFDRL